LTTKDEDMEARETPHVAGRLAGKVAIIGGAGSIGPGWGNGKAPAQPLWRLTAIRMLPHRQLKLSAQKAAKQSPLKAI
jgi:hypothetical protein